MDDACGRICKGHDVVADQVVDEQHRGVLDSLEGFESEQFGVTGTRTHQSYFSVVHSCLATRKICSTCCAIEAGSAYKTKLAALLGPTVLKEWILVVPRWEDKSLLAHAEDKIKSLRTAGLGFIAPEIVPGICTTENFIVERQQLVQAGKESLRIAAALVDQAQITDWVAANDVLVARLDGKALAIRHQDAATARKLRDESVRHYLDGQNALTKLRADYPDIFEVVDRIKKDKEHFLATESLTTSALPPDHWRETRDSLEAEHAQALHGLDRFTVRQFVHEAVADWLLRCPLDFPTPPSHGSTPSQH